MDSSNVSSYVQSANPMDAETRLSGRIDALQTALARSENKLREEMTAACNAVRLSAHDRISAVEGRLTDQMSALRSRMTIAVVMLGGILAVVAWAAMQPVAEAEKTAVSSDRRMEELVHAVRMLDPDNPDHWTADHEPRTSILEQVLSVQLGYPVRVTMAERDLAVVLSGAKR